MKYVDPDGRVILGINETFNMSSYTDIYLGNSQTDKISTAGCYIVMFANIFASSNYYQMSLTNSNKYDSPIKINNDKSLFTTGSGLLCGRIDSMNKLFGVGNWDYWTKDKQGLEGIYQKLAEYQKSEKAYFIVGIFDLSSDTPIATNHMIGISELPDKDGYFVSGLTASSNGDINRLINIRDKSAYNIDNLKEIRIIFLEDK